MFHGAVIIRGDSWDIVDLLRAGVCRATSLFLGQRFWHWWKQRRPRALELSECHLVRKPEDRTGVLGMLGKLPTDSPLLSCRIEVIL